MQRVELSVGTVKASLGYSDDSERELILKTARELNTECNRLIMSCGNVDETILLFFLLMKTEIKLQKINYRNVDDMLFGILKSIGNYVHEKNSTKIKESLVAIGIIRKIELNSVCGDGKDGIDVYDDNELITLIKSFAGEVNGSVETIENNIYLL
ncbi:MAG: hypothetical protein LBB24_02705 [Rickettsiales bacterium]|jgi:hypothetical protein|nr:hypothetical protein [Rickettsiales bacterium]